MRANRLNVGSRKALVGMDIILVKTDGLEFGQLEKYLSCVTAPRRAGIERKKSGADKLCALLSELLVLSEITLRTGLAQREISFRRGAHGKPYIKQREAAGLEFSLSHTAGAIAAAFSARGEIGVDIERKNRPISERLYSRMLCEEERIRTLSSGDFIRAWVQKEAFLKRLGIGISRDLRGVNSLRLPDTAAIDVGDYFIGVSGDGALNAAISEITVKELLERFNC